jgi:signal transduction histidine kinase
MTMPGRLEEYNRTMQSKSVVPVRDPTLLDATTYISLVVMSLLGIQGLHTLQAQLIGLGLCAVFGLLYRFVFRTGYYEKNPALYFGPQLIVLVLLLLLQTTSMDALNFLYLIVSIQAAMVLTRPAATLWIAAYYLTVSAATLITRGADGLYAAAFYLAAYVACGFFGYILQQAELARQHNQELIEELQSTQQKLKDLAVLEERNRLARELHDSVKQQVFAVSMQLSAARATLVESDKAYTPVAQAERLAQQAGAELTTLIHELRPPGLEHRDLSAALHSHVAEWSRLNDVTVEINIQEGLSAPVPVEQALFRVAQEALSNVARHSRASRVSVRLAGEGQDVLLTIADNGLGFDFDNPVKGVGLDSMSERLESVGGTLEVSSPGRQGTCVTARARRS